MTVAIVVYVMWSSEIKDESVLTQLTVVPFVLGLLRYAFHVTTGDAEEPERILMKDRVFLMTILLWCGMFAVRNVLP